MGLKDYLKCVRANKFTLGGYISLAVSGVLIYISGDEILSPECFLVSFPFATAGLMALAGTFGGLDTLSSYKMMSQHIERHGTIDRRYARKFPNFYCNQSGIKLAAKEAGLEDLLEEHLSNQ